MTDYLHPGVRVEWRGPAGITTGTLVREMPSNTWLVATPAGRVRKQDKALYPLGGIVHERLGEPTR